VKKSDRIKRLRRIVAHHEAGHALVGTLELGNFEKISIVANNETWGRYSSREYLRPEHLAGMNNTAGRYGAWIIAEQCSARIRRDIAGHVAESILDPEEASHWMDLLLEEEGEPASDMAGAVGWSRARFSALKSERANELRAGREIHTQWSNAEEWLQRPGNWRCIEAIANALLKRGTLEPNGFYRILSAHPEVMMPIVEPPKWVAAYRRTPKNGITIIERTGVLR
jgi:hypothetical protein